MENDLSKVSEKHNLRDDMVAEAIKDPSPFVTLLKDERSKYSKSDKEKIELLVDILTKSGYYPSEPTPAMKKYNYTYVSMVEGYGVNWHTFEGMLECPHCKADLRAKDNGVLNPPFKREIGVEVQGVYDGVLYYTCPDCKGVWSRRGTKLTEKQLRGLNANNFMDV